MLIFDEIVLELQYHTYRRHKVLAVLLLFMFSKAMAQNFSSRCELHQQGKVDVIISDSCFMDDHTKNKVLDSVFASCNLALMQLEKNLIYRMSNRIKFILFNNLLEFSKFESGHPNIQKIEFDEAGNYHFHFPIFVGCNFQKIDYQIRKGTANQMIEEYLYGLSYRDKINGIRFSQIPIWMIKGFTEYFARGIEIHDFQNFTQFEQNGFFKNINYIPTEAQTNFGSIIWYLFEKEKGRGFNSAFWYLIKYINSFQGSFEYQFGQKFKDWLRNKISEIANQSHYDHVKSEFFTPVKSGKNSILNQLKLLKSKNQNLYVLNFQLDRFQRLSVIDQIQKKRIYESIAIKIGDYLQLNQFEVTHPSDNKIDQNENMIMLHFFEGHWMLSKINAKAEIVHLVKLGRTGIYHKLKTLKNGYSMIHEDNGNIEIMIISISGQLTNRMIVKQQNLLDYLIQNDSQFYFMSSEKRKDQLKLSYLTQHTEDKIDTLFSDSNSISTIRFEDLIVESKDHLSFIKSGETQQQVVHLFKKLNQWQSKKVQSKGHFYRQELYEKEQTIRYSFQTKNGIEQGEYPVDEMIYDQDTFIKKKFSFDTSSIDSENAKSIAKYDSSNGYFLSQFKENTSHFKKPNNLHSLANSRIVKSNFEQTFYATLSRIYLSNEELDLPYLFTIPLNKTFNSIATLFLQEQIESDNKSQVFNFKGFVSFDRMRYGIKLLHQFRHNSYTHHSELIFRSRQNRSDFGDALENKSTQLNYQLSKNHNQLNFNIGLRYQLQADISLNTNERNTLLQNNYYHIGGISFGFSPLKALQFGHITCTYLMQAEFATLKNESVVSNLSRLHAEGNLHYQNKNLRFRSSLNANYSLMNQHMVYFIGGSKGSLQSNQFESSQINGMSKFPTILLQHSGFIRGFLVGSRVGNQSVVIQNEFLLSPLSFFPSRVIESNFLKKLFFVGFLDFGTAFVGTTPADVRNPYNTIFYKGNTYDLSVTAIRDPYLLGIGYGINMNIWGYEFKIEKAYGITEGSIQNRLIHFSIGKNF